MTGVRQLAILITEVSCVHRQKDNEYVQDDSLVRNVHTGWQVYASFMILELASRCEHLVTGPIDEHLRIVFLSMNVTIENQIEDIKNLTSSIVRVPC